MKTIYHSKNNKERRKTLLALIAVAIFLGLFIMTGLFSKTFYRSMMVLTFSSDKASQTASSFGALFSSRASLESENQELKKQIEQAKIDLADRELLAKENADLKALRHMEEDTKGIAATITSKPPFAPFDVITSDAGEKQGVKEGDRVMIGETFLGTVTSVSSYSSRITLLSSPSLKTEAYIGDSALPVTLNGKGGGNFDTSLPQGSGVKEGDLVYAYYNQNPLFIGKVSKVIETEASTLMTVLLTYSFNLYSLNHVEIVPSK